MQPQQKTSRIIVKSNDQEWKLRQLVFKQLCGFCRSIGGISDTNRIFGKSIQLTSINLQAIMAEFPDFSVMHNLDNQQSKIKYINDISSRVASYMMESYDPSKVRPLPKSTRASRLERNLKIVDLAKKEPTLSIRQLAEKFGISTRIVTDSLHQAKISPRRDSKVMALPSHTWHLLEIFDKFAPINRITVFRNSDILKIMRHELKLLSFDIIEQVDVINRSKLNYYIALDSRYTVVSRAKRKNQAELLEFLSKVINLRDNRQIHSLVEVDNVIETGKMSRLISVIECLQRLAEDSPLHILERLWLNSFEFRDPERVRIELRRALATEARLNLIINASTINSVDAPMISNLASLTLRCADFNASNNPAQANELWLTETDVRQLIEPSDCNRFDTILESCQKAISVKEFDLFINGIVKGLPGWSLHMARIECNIAELFGTPYLSKPDDEFVDDGSAKNTIITGIKTRHESDTNWILERQVFDSELVDDLGPDSFEPD